MALYAGQNVTAGQLNDELEVTSYRAGQKVRPSQIDNLYVAGDHAHAQEINLHFDLD